MKSKILYVDDQPLNIELYRELLEPAFEFIGTDRADQVASLISQHHFHAIMLDVHMPQIGGFDLYKEIVEHTHYNGCPVFFISGDISFDNKLRSFQNGGVDFIPRDLPTDELSIRLTNKIRHFQNISTNIKLGNLDLDVESLTVTVSNFSVDVTLLEFKILLMIMRAYPRPITKVEMIQQIWGAEPIKSGTVNTHLTNLRAKIEAWDHTIKVKDESVFLVQ